MSRPPSTSISADSVTPADIIPVFGCLVVLMILALVLFLPQREEVFVWDLSTPFAISTALPWVLAMALLIVPRRRMPHMGMTLTASFAIIALVPALVLMVASWFITYVSFYIVVRKEYFAIPGAVAMLLGTSIVAIRAARKVPVADRAERAWPVTIGIATAYALVVFGGTAVLVARANALALVKQRNQNHMYETIPVLKKCLAAYAKAHPERGYPSSLTDLSVGPTPCLASTTVSGEADGFRYEYVPLLPDDSGVVREFMACVRPGPGTAPPAFTEVFDETGRNGTGGEFRRFTIRSCQSMWGFDYPQMVKFCVARFAAAHADRGYPATLADIGPSGDGCLASDGHTIELSIDHDILTTNFGRYGYKAAPRDANGRITRYELARADLPFGSNR